MLRGVLYLRPGLTGWTTVRYRNEEQALANVPASRLKQATLRTHLSVGVRTVLAMMKTPL
jgi:hypothetical protein